MVGYYRLLLQSFSANSPLVVVHVEGVGLQKKGTVASPAGTDRLLPSSACRYKKEISCRN
jgi:hypothetical protein